MPPCPVLFHLLQLCYSLFIIYVHFNNHYLSFFVHFSLAIIHGSLFTIRSRLQRIGSEETSPCPVSSFIVIVYQLSVIRFDPIFGRSFPSIQYSSLIMSHLLFMAYRLCVWFKIWGSDPKETPPSPNLISSVDHKTIVTHFHCISLFVINYSSFCIYHLLFIIHCLWERGVSIEDKVPTGRHHALFWV